MCKNNKLLLKRKPCIDILPFGVLRKITVTVGTLHSVHFVGDLDHLHRVVIKGGVG